MVHVKAPRLLVLGGSGFIGHHVVRRGCELGWEVVSLGLNKPAETRMESGVRYVVADLTRAESLMLLNDRCFNYVVNLSGYIDHSLFKSGGRRVLGNHLQPLLNLLEYLDRTSLVRFVQIGSSDEYGNGPAPQREDQREMPISPYSLAKVAATHFLQMLHRSEKLPAVTLRLFLTYGPGQEERRLLPQIIRNCLRDHEFSVSLGEQIRDFCFVGDIVNAIYRCFECDDVNGRILNIGSGNPQKIREIIEYTVNLIGAGRPQFGKIPYRPGESMTLYADTTAARDILGWTPRIAIKEGILRTIESIEKCHG